MICRSDYWAALAHLANEALNIIDQGPAMSRALSTPKAGKFHSGLPTEIPWLDTSFGNAANAYMQALSKLQQLGMFQTTLGIQWVNDELITNVPTYSAGGVNIGALITPDLMKWDFKGMNPQIFQQYQQQLFPNWDWKAVTQYQNQPLSSD